MNLFTKKYFFGWGNFKWLVREVSYMYSNKKSFFSKKRIESSSAFIAALSIIVGHIIYTRNTITNSEVLADATLLFAIAGYTVNQIQKEKKDSPDNQDFYEKELKKTEQTKKIIIENNKNEKKDTDFSKDEDSI